MPSWRNGRRNGATPELVGTGIDSPATATLAAEPPGKTIDHLDTNRIAIRNQET